MTHHHDTTRQLCTTIHNLHHHCTPRTPHNPTGLTDTDLDIAHDATESIFRSLITLRELINTERQWQPPSHDTDNAGYVTGNTITDPTSTATLATTRDRLRRQTHESNAQLTRTLRRAQRTLATDPSPADALLALRQASRDLFWRATRHEHALDHHDGRNQ